MLEATNARRGIRGQHWSFVTASDTSQRLTETATETAPKRRVIGRPWVKGQTGNPLGRAGKAGARAREARQQEIYASIIADVGAKLNPLEDAFAQEAARQMARAATSSDDALRVRLHNAAAKTIERLRQSTADRAAKAKLNLGDILRGQAHD